MEVTVFGGITQKQQKRAHCEAGETTLNLQEGYRSNRQPWQTRVQLMIFRSDDSKGDIVLRGSDVQHFLQMLGKVKKSYTQVTE